MELFQIFWDDQKNLFLEFKKNEDEKKFLLPNKIRTINLQFEISKNEWQKSPPYLISIHRLYYTTDTFSFKIELDELVNMDELQIKILHMVIILVSGQRIQYAFTRSFSMVDISINDECYDGYKYEDLKLKSNIKNKITKEKIFHEIKTNLDGNEEQRTEIYEKHKIEKVIKDDSLISMIHENNKTLKSIAQELKNISLSLQNLPNNVVSYNPSVPVMRNQKEGIERIKIPMKPTLIQGQLSSAKLMVIKEMKSIFEQNVDDKSNFNVKAILKPLTEEELKNMMLDDEILKKKEEIAINNQIKRIEKQKEKQIHLKDLKKPK
ncbi:MAG: hypothetical protein ACFFB0_20680 [Promethearchaeota archaeon]